MPRLINYFLLPLLILFSIQGNTQVLFEKGYFIDNQGETHNCFIQNKDWKNNPTKFRYKVSQLGRTNETNIHEVQEFGINDQSKYVRDTALIDISSNKTSELSYVQSPEYVEKVVFLKVLVEGQSNLYEFSEGNIKLFFFRDKNNIEPLIYKKYRSYDNIRENKTYKQQLLNNLQCDQITFADIENIAYVESDLTRIFKQYSNCHETPVLELARPEKREFIHLYIRPRLNISSLDLWYAGNELETFQFNYEPTFGLGMDMEYYLPYNKNKWAILLESTYQYYVSETGINPEHPQAGRVTATVRYHSFELPISLRYYLYFGNNWSFLIDGSFVLDVSAGTSSVDFNPGSRLVINSKPNLGLGIGFNYNKMYSMEFRYLHDRDLMNTYITQRSAYRTFSLILGYSLFRSKTK